MEVQMIFGPVCPTGTKDVQAPGGYPGDVNS